MSLREKAAKGLVWSVIQKWGREGISFLTFVVLSRLLDPEAFGLVALALVFTSFVEIFVDQGISAAIVQRADLEPEHLDTGFWAGVSLGGVLAAGGIAASGWVAALLGEPRLAPIVRWLSVGFLLLGMSTTQVAILQRELVFKSLAVRSLVANTIAGIVGIGMALLGFGVWSLVVQNLTGALVRTIVLWRASNWRPRFRVSLGHFRDLYAFGVSVVGNNLLKVLVRRSDDFLIGYYLGPTLLGYYTIGYRLLLVITRVVTGITNSVALPVFSRMQQDRKRMLRAFYAVTRYTSLLAFPVFIGLAVVAPELVPTVFGPKWTPSIPVMQTLSMIGILHSMLFFTFSVMKAAGKPSWQLGIMFLNAVCSVIGFLVAVRWGIVAVAASFVIVGYLLSPISYLAIRKLVQVDLKTYARQFIPPAFATLIMVVAVLGSKYVLSHHALKVHIQLCIYVTVGGLAYVVAIVSMARSLSREVLELAGVFAPRLKPRRVS